MQLPFEVDSESGEDLRSSESEESNDDGDGEASGMVDETSASDATAMDDERDVEELEKEVVVDAPREAVGRSEENRVDETVKETVVEGAQKVVGRAEYKRVEEKQDNQIVTDDRPRQDQPCPDRDVGQSQNQVEGSGGVSATDHGVGNPRPVAAAQTDAGGSVHNMARENDTGDSAVEVARNMVEPKVGPMARAESDTNQMRVSVRKSADTEAVEAVRLEAAAKCTRVEGDSMRDPKKAAQRPDAAEAQRANHPGPVNPGVKKGGEHSPGGRHLYAEHGVERAGGGSDLHRGQSSGRRQGSSREDGINKEGGRDKMEHRRALYRLHLAREDLTANIARMVEERVEMVLARAGLQKDSHQPLTAAGKVTPMHQSGVAQADLRAQPTAKAGDMGSLDGRPQVYFPNVDLAAYGMNPLRFELWEKNLLFTANMPTGVWSVINKLHLDKLGNFLIVRKETREWIQEKDSYQTALCAGVARAALLKDLGGVTGEEGHSVLEHAVGLLATMSVMWDVSTHAAEAQWKTDAHTEALATHLDRKIAARAAEVAGVVVEVLRAVNGRVLDKESWVPVLAGALLDKLHPDTRDEATKTMTRVVARAITYWCQCCMASKGLQDQHGVGIGIVMAKRGAWENASADGKENT
ncbi:unnamed protein product [Closterium sp. Yama58-4]|nr:unnamed protein product [Closterium sp. Yama58-4]